MMLSSSFRAVLLAMAGLAVALPARAADQAPKKEAPKGPPKYEVMDYGPFLMATIVAPAPGGNITNKGIAIKVGPHGEGTMLFDADLMRWSAGWSGGFLNYTGVAFSGAHGPNPTVKGEVGFVTAVGPGWGYGDQRGEFIDPRDKPFGRLPDTWAKYHGLYLDGDRVVISYSVGDTAVLESPGLAILDGGAAVYTRTLHIDKTAAKRDLLVADVVPTATATADKPAKAPKPADDQPAAPAPVMASVKLPAMPETHTIAGLIGAPKGAKLDTLDGGRIVLRLPALTEETTFTLAVARVATEDSPKFDAWLASQPAPAADSLGKLLGGGPARWGDAIETQGTLGASTSPDGSYSVDTITAPVENPYHSWLRFGGFDFFKDGKRAAICTWSGDVWIVSGIDESLEHLKWKRFATGLFQPLGLRIVDDKIYVNCRDELMRVTDLNGDGEADFYECFNNDVIVTPSFHEFQLDLQSDRAGNFYFAKAGAVAPGGRGWQLISPHNGIVARISADGKKFDVFATGVRAPNGMGISPDDQLTLADNEGTWTPACRLNLVNEGDFLGVADLAHREKTPDNYGNPIFWLPHGGVDNSSGGQAWVPDDNRWGPFRGDIIHSSYGTSSIFLVLREDVDGIHQGGAVRFPLSFATGVMRQRFNPVDGQLYMCGLKGWQTNAAQDTAFQRVRFTGKPVAMPASLHVKAGGIEIGFTTALDKKSAEDVQNYAVEQWNYKWTSAYGSPEFSVANPNEKGHDPVEVKSVKTMNDGKSVFLEIPNLTPVMQMKIKFLINAAGGAPLDFEIYNTIAKVPGK